MQFPDGKDMQINLTGFLNQKNARTFVTELWDLLSSAMDNIGGIPAKFVEEKKQEIRRKQVRNGACFCDQLLSLLVAKIWMKGKKKSETCPFVLTSG